MHHRFLFNFAVSHSGGGLKRLSEYARWFHNHGGAGFVVHPRCRDLLDLYPENQYFVTEQRGYQRIFSDCSYLTAIETAFGRPALYYSYGIPIYAPVGEVNWFHLSNVLPLRSAGIPLPLLTRIKMAILGRRIVRTYRYADVVSAESGASLELVDRAYANRRVLSVNGSDDEIECLANPRMGPKDDIAVVVGTQRYKALLDSYRVFEVLRQRHPLLRLVIIGPDEPVPSALRQEADVRLAGSLPRSEVIAHLRKARFYISTTRTENSYNAAAEGAVFADESYVSDIGPHRELLAGVAHDRVTVPGVAGSLLHVTRGDMATVALKSWDHVITDMIAHVRQLSDADHR